VGGICASIAIKRHRLPELPIFARIGGEVALTVFVDVRGQIWFARKLIDLAKEIGIDEYVTLE